MKEQTEYLGGDVLYLMPSAAHTQSMGIVLQSDKGLVVIDGGTASESIPLENLLEKLGGKVESWFLTHPHHDHIQALTGIAERGKIEIGKAYYDFPPEEYVAALETRDKRVSCVPAFEAALKNAGINTEKPVKGRPVYAAGFTFTPLSTGIAFENDLNCSSIVYKVKTRGSDLLILGDMNYKRQQEVVDEYADLLPSTVVQMAHHGQQGVSEEFYKLVNPKVCLWCTPKWLWENDPVGKGYNSGPYKTLETRGWIEKLGAKNVNAFDEIAILK